MSRFLRKLTSRIKVHELLITVVVLMISALLGFGALSWYETNSGTVQVIVAVNGLDTTEETSKMQGVEKNQFYAFEQDDRVPNGFPVVQNSYNIPVAQYAPTFIALSESNGSKVNQNGYKYATVTQKKSEIPLITEDENNRNTNIDEKNAASDRMDSNGESKQTDSSAEKIVEYMVKVSVDEQKKVFTTSEKTVEQLFQEKGIDLGEKDKLVGAYYDGVINSDLYIEVKRVTTKTVYEEKAIAPKTVYKDNPKMSSGTTKVTKNGVDGKKKLQYLITMEDGEQVDKKLIKEEVLKKPVNKVVEQGTASAAGTHEAKGGQDFKYSQVIEVKCSAYTSSYEDTGKRPGDPLFGITATGMKATEGVVAVDPKVIPLGSKLYIEFADGTDYGYAIAGDTGSKIKGKKVDLYFDADRQTLLQFGVKKAKVYILE